MEVYYDVLYYGVQYVHARGNFAVCLLGLRGNFMSFVLKVNARKQQNANTSNK